MGAPSFTNVETPWLPLAGPRTAVVLARRHGPRFYAEELADLGALARLAAALMPDPDRVRA